LIYWARAMSIIDLFKKRKAALSSEERHAVIVERLRNEEDWIPVIQDLFSGKYEPDVVDTNIWIWDYEGIFEKAYRAVSPLPESRQRLRNAVLVLLDAGKEWYRLAAQDFAKQFAISEAKPRLLELINSKSVRPFQANGSSMFANTSETELSNIAVAIEGLNGAQAIEPILRQWLDSFLKDAAPAFQQWNGLRRRKKDELHNYRELATTSLQILSRRDPNFGMQRLRDLCELGSPIHQWCCRLGGEQARKDVVACKWVERAFYGGFLDKLNYEETQELANKYFEGLPSEKMEMIHASLGAAHRNKQILEKTRKA